MNKQKTNAITEQSIGGDLLLPDSWIGSYHIGLSNRGRKLLKYSKYRQSYRNRDITENSALGVWF